MDMVRHLVILILALAFFPVKAQGIICPMDLNEEEYLRVMEARRELRENIAANPLGTDDAINYYVPLKIHIMGTDNGQGYYSLIQLFDQLCELNTHFANAGFRFYLVPDVEFHNDSRFMNLSGTSWQTDPNTSPGAKLSEMTSLFYQDTAVNIYFTSGTGICGMAPFPSTLGRNGVLMENSCANTPSKKTLAHELGHHFDLLHTFQGYNSTNPVLHEYVTREIGIRNCETAGDGFCDTPADYQNSACPFVPDPNKKDLRGDIYLPDPTLIMSYYGDNCQSRFSEQQAVHMRNIIANNTKRKVYLQRVIPDTTQVPNTTHILPEANEDLPHSIPYEFTWEDVGADAYLFTVYRATVLRFETLVSGTSFQYTPLVSDANTTMRWRVKPIRYGKLCSEFTGYRNFRVTGPTPLFENVSGVMNIYPNPVSGSMVRVVLPESYTPGDNAVISLYNTLGVELLRLDNADGFMRSSREFEVNLPSLPAGIYHLGIRSDTGNFISRMVVK